MFIVDLMLFDLYYYMDRFDCCVILRIADFYRFEIFGIVINLVGIM